jgi:DNA repair protein RecO (recombination protein O)
MEWREEGLILAVRRHGETSAIAEIFTRDRGRWLGLIRGGRSRAQRPVLQLGNLVAAHWHARLEEHLGLFVVDPITLNAGWLIEDGLKLAALSSITGLCQVLPEREPHPRLFDATRLVIAALDDDSIWPALMVRWELGLLDELGFGLDLLRCAATGANEELAYVSPRTGRAVSREAGEPWRERLLPLPDFLLGTGCAPGDTDIDAGFRLTGYFLQRHVFEARNVAPPAAREQMLARLSVGGSQPAASGAGS